MLTDKQKTHVLKQHLTNISHISDKDYQRRVWIKGEGPECDDFDETVNHFFVDMDSVLKEYTDFGITNAQYQILRQFYDEFQIFCKGPAHEYYLPQLFIDIPAWTKITEMAKEVLREFKDFLHPIAERNRLYFGQSIQLDRFTKFSTLKTSVMSINRDQIVEMIVRIVSHVSDKDYQRRIWIRGEGPECDDFDETCCNFFGDADPLLENYTDYGITNAQYQILKKFRDQFYEFSRDNDWPSYFIDTPEWTKITEMAKEVLNAFNYSKASPREIHQEIKISSIDPQ